MNREHIGSDFDDFLEEEGILKELMTRYILTWDLKKDIEAAKNLLNQDKMDVLTTWYGKENYDKLLTSYPEGGNETADEWVKNNYINRLNDIIQLLQIITNETQDNSLVQKRLKAVGFTPQ